MVAPMQIATLTTSTRQSICPGKSITIPAAGEGNASTSALRHQYATATPPAAAISESNNPSVKSCFTRRRRPAPRASRIVISWRRSKDRASKRLLTFAHAMSNTKNTTAIVIAIRIRKIVFQPLRDRVQLGLRLLTHNARFEKCVAFDPTGPTVFQFVTGRVECLLHRRRHPKAERVTDKGAVKLFRCDANDRVLHAIEILRLADNLRVGLVTISPGSITDHDHRMRIASGSFFGSESAA